MAELPKNYDPSTVEPRWYQRWLERGAFHANASSSKPAYAIVIPPPNITGVLTMGHVLNNTIQDILVRRARMRGFEALWLPGTDHAGLATQTAVEKSLRKEGSTRHELGREEFIRRVWEWQEKHGGIITTQLMRLGCSCDWARSRFTLDPDYARAVQQVFVELYDKGLIYRGRRMVNWDPVALTALSDEEVIPTPQKSALYYVRYELLDQPGEFVEVATTRPETIMADAALAVHPADRRGLVGRKVWRPLARAAIPVIADDAIDLNFGTGVLKVTPAHDKLDFEIGNRHNLPVVDVLTADARINCPEVAELHGLDRFMAREKAVELLRERGLLSRIEPHESNVGFSERAGVPVEPRVSEQWFLRYPRTEEALRVVREHLIRFFPTHWEKVYEQWLTNIHDWCISRQVWWGHRIPAWYKEEQGASAQRKESGKLAERSTVVSIDSPGEGWVQDADTLDTWFSSWLWAFATMDASTRAKFYPTSALVTAPDILFFWVARMIIAGLEFKPGKTERDEDNIPFRDVFFTGLIRDARGRKMSKSLGNSPDPLDLMRKYGADGLRFGLMRIAPSGQDIRFDEKQIEEGRNFATKVWNAARFRQLHGPSRPRSQLEQASRSIYAVEVMARLNETIRAVEAAYTDYQFNIVAQRLYDFVWGDYCDWFVEAAKTDIYGEDAGRKEAALATMDYVLSAIVRLLHPFMPHVTDELWSIMNFAPGSEEFLDFSTMPEQLDLGDRRRVEAARRQVKQIQEIVQAGRNLRAESRVPSSQKTRWALRTTQKELAAESATIARLLRAESLDISDHFQPPPGSSTAATEGGELFLLAAEMDRGAERERLHKEIATLEGELRDAENRLANPKFIERAPAPVIEEHRRRQSEFAQRLTQLRTAVAGLE